ncbi:MAG: PIN/TRAM domain-containing protein, partial [Planctomycetaceae bacterium]
GSGRRGRALGSRRQSHNHIDVRIAAVQDDTATGQSTDQRLVDVAKDLGGAVVTNDFNLNKVASVHGVDVINLNDLANCLRPRHLPGERIKLRIVKAGEAAGQGVGYLDDGTMVVCEDGGAMIGKDTEIIVKSVLQQSAGRLIFGRLPTPGDR